MYHDKQAAIIVKHISQQHSQQAAHTLSFSHSDLETTMIDDLRQILNNAGNSTSHILRYRRQTQITNHTPNEMDNLDTMGTALDYTY